MSLQVNAGMDELVIEPPLEFSDLPSPGAENDPEFVENFFCDVTRNDAVTALKEADYEGAFIVRPGSSSPYCISFLHAGEIMHMKIRKNNIGLYYLGDTNVELFFKNMSQLLAHVTTVAIQASNGLTFRLTFNAKPYVKCNSSSSSSSSSSTENISQRAADERRQSSGSSRSNPAAAAAATAAAASADNQQQQQQQQRQRQQKWDYERRKSSVSSFTSGSAANQQPLDQQLQSEPLIVQQQKARSQYAAFKPIAKQPYFFDVKRDEADNFLLKQKVEGLFIVRPGKSSPYCLSIFHRGRIVHLKIVTVNKKFALEQHLASGEDYFTVPDLIESLLNKNRTLTLMNGETVVLMPVED